MLLDYYYSIKYMLTLKVVISEGQLEELIEIQKLGNYYFPIIKGMLNRCIRRDQSDYVFVKSILNYNEINEIRQHLQKNLNIAEEISVIRVFEEQLLDVKKVINKELKYLEEDNWFTKIELAKVIIENIVKDDYNEEVLYRGLLEHISIAEESRKSKTNLNKIPFKKLKNKFKDNIKLMERISEIEVANM